MDEEKNSGLIQYEFSPSDWVAGAIPYREVCEDWTPYLPTGERQNFRFFDTMACVSFSALNAIETQLNRLYSLGLLSYDNRLWLERSGYVKDGKINCSDRFLAKVSNTTRLGNSCTIVADFLRHAGAVPESDWASSETFEWDSYYAPIPSSLISKGREFASRFEVQYEVLWSGGDVPDTNLLIAYHAKHAPIQLATRVCPGWNTGEVAGCGSYPTQHATIAYGANGGTYILDSYDPYPKRLLTGYGIPFAMKIVIKEKSMPKPQFWAQANSVLFAFTGLTENEPDATQLANAWLSGDQVKVNEILARYKGSESEEQLKQRIIQAIQNL